MKCGFELHGFFLEPKTAYLEALLYIYIHMPVVYSKASALKIPTSNLSNNYNTALLLYTCSFLVDGL